MSDSIIKTVSPYYEANAYKWVYAIDHLSGRVLDESTRGLGTTGTEEAFARDDGGTDRPDALIARYLYQRLQGEDDKAYIERQRIADYVPNYARAVITLAGMSSLVDKDSAREWNPQGLGDPNEEGSSPSIMSRLWEDADGSGTNWPTLFNAAKSDLVACKEIWCLVDGIKRNAENEPLNDGTVHFILPQDVPDFVEDESGRLVAVKVRDKADLRTTIEEAPDERTVFFVYDLDGVERIVCDKEGKEVESRERVAEYEYYTDARRKERCLPIFRVKLPIRTNLGYLMARAANAIYNLSNVRDYVLWVSGFAKLFADVMNEDGSLNIELWDELIAALQEGKSLLPGSGHKYGVTPMDGATVRGETIKEKTEAFYAAFFQSYGDAAKERTATEIRQDFRAGLESFLVLLNQAIDEAENRAMFLLGQVNYPNQPERWVGTHVERSDDFSAVDLEGNLSRAIALWSPTGRLPVTAGILSQLTRRAAENYRVDLTEEGDGIDEASRRMLDTEAQAGDVFASLRTRRTTAVLNGE